MTCNLCWLPATGAAPCKSVLRCVDSTPRPAVCVVADIVWWLSRVRQPAKGAAQASSGPGVLPKDHRPVQFWWPEGMHLTKKPAAFLLLFWLLFTRSYLDFTQSYLCVFWCDICLPAITSAGTFLATVCASQLGPHHEPVKLWVPTAFWPSTATWSQYSHMSMTHTLQPAWHWFWVFPSVF